VLLLKISSRAKPVEGLLLGSRHAHEIVRFFERGVIASFDDAVGDGLSVFDRRSSPRGSCKSTKSALRSYRLNVVLLSVSMV
jgi:hypothetical protein